MALCAACSHPERKSLDRQLIEGKVSPRMLATAFGLSPAGVKRHAVHMRERIQIAQGGVREFRSSLDYCYERVDAVIARAERARGKKDVLLLRAVAERRALIELEFGRRDHLDVTHGAHRPGDPLPLDSATDEELETLLRVLERDRKATAGRALRAAPAGDTVEEPCASASPPTTELTGPTS